MAWGVRLRAMALGGRPHPAFSRLAGLSYILSAVVGQARSLARSLRGPRRPGLRASYARLHRLKPVLPAGLETRRRLRACPTRSPISRGELRWPAPRPGGSHNGTPRACERQEMPASSILVAPELDRRQNVRFPMQLSVRYHLAKGVGWGRVLNIGSGGALLTIDQPVQPGQRVELHIGWPVRQPENVHLNLIAGGTVVRVEDGRAAVRFERCHFRTASAAFRRLARLPELRGGTASHW